MGSRLWGLGRNQDGQLMNTTKINANRPKPAVSSRPLCPQSSTYHGETRSCTHRSPVLGAWATAKEQLTACEVSRRQNF